MSVARMLPIKRKILGVALRNARERARRTAEDVAGALGWESAYLAGLERGSGDISWPDLEAVAEYLDVTPEDLLAGSLPEAAVEVEAPQARLLRNRIIGAKLRAARAASDASMADLAAEIGVEEAVMQSYERGLTPIPASILVELANLLDVSMGDLTGAAEPDAEPDEDLPDLGHLSDEMIRFIAAPENQSLLTLAAKLGGIDADALRALGHALSGVGDSE